MVDQDNPFTKVQMIEEALEDANLNISEGTLTLSNLDEKVVRGGLSNLYGKEMGQRFLKLTKVYGRLGTVNLKTEELSGVDYEAGEEISEAVSVWNSEL